jgi:hypothetical protein
MPGRDITEQIDAVLDEPSELDRLALGPDAARAAPRGRPAAEPRPPRQAAHRKGPVEAATARDLKALPPAMRAGALAATALRLAREIDTGALTARDLAGHARELRMHMTQLFDSAPGGSAGDVTDEVRDRRERRLAAGGDA